MQDIHAQIEELKPWWEDVTIQGISTKSIDKGAGRNKELLFSKLFDQVYGREFFNSKTVLDLGSNAGGTAIEMLKRGASFVTCVEGSTLAFKQLGFVLQNNPAFEGRTQTINLHLANKSTEELEFAFGQHEIGFCIGLIYHMKEKDVISLMKYMRANTGRCIFSSPTKNTGRTTDWSVDHEGIDRLLMRAGFQDKVVLLDAKEGEQDWSWMTNTYYFEAIR